MTLPGENADHPENAENAGYLKRLMQGTALSAINFFVILALSFWLAPYMVHTLGERLNGIWQAVATLTGWYALLDFGLNYAVSRFITKSFSSKDYAECNIYASTGLSLFLLIGTIVVVLSLIFGFGASYFFPKIEDIGLLKMVIILSGAAFALDFPLRALTGISLGTMRHDLVGLGSIVFRILGAVMTFLILAWGGRLIALALGNIVLMIVQIQTYYILARRSFPQLQLSRKNVRRSYVKPLVNYSIYGFIAHIGNAFIFQLDKLLIPVFLSFQFVSPYAIAVQFADHSRGLMLAMSNWMNTWLTFLHSKGLHDELLKTLQFGFKTCVYLSGFVIFGLVAWSDPFITRWMLNEEAVASGKVDLIYWGDIVPCTILLALSAGIRMVQEPLVRYLYATANHHYYAFSNVAEGILNAVLSIILAKYCGLGLIGFAWGTLIASLFFRGLYIPVITCRLLKQSLFWYYGGMLWLFMLTGIALVLPILVTLWLVAPNYPALFLVGAISAVLYFPAVYLIGFSREERQRFKDFLGKRKPF